MLRADPRIRLPRQTLRCGSFCSLTSTRNLTNCRPRWPGKASRLGVPPFTSKQMKKRPRRPKPLQPRDKLHPCPRHLPLPSQISHKSERFAEGVTRNRPIARPPFDEKNLNRSRDGSPGDGVLRRGAQAECPRCPGEHECAAGPLLGRSDAPRL